MQFMPVQEDPKQYLDLLLLADESETMIESYLERGTLFVLQEPEGVIGVCVVTDEGGGVLEIKNLAIDPQYQGHGYGRLMIEKVAKHFASSYAILQVGTGDSPLTVPFYEKCGFSYYTTLPHFFIDHYDHPIVEAGKQLVDMIVLRRDISV